MRYHVYSLGYNNRFSKLNLNQMPVAISFTIVLLATATWL